MRSINCLAESFLLTDITSYVGSSGFFILNGVNFPLGMNALFGLSNGSSDLVHTLSWLVASALDLRDCLYMELSEDVTVTILRG